MSGPALSFYDTEPGGPGLADEVRAGLSARPRRLSPRLFYDRRGAALFEAICRTPEYYVTRTEARLLARHARDIAALTGRGVALLEPGAGGCGKVRLLLDALHPRVFLPVEICRDVLLAAARGLARDYPWLRVSATCADFTDLAPPAGTVSGARRVVFFPGSTIGNFEPPAAQALLRRLARWAGDGGGLIIGVDLKKAADRLNAAYNDAQGVTAAFNLNLLARLNRELGAGFDLARFRHHAFYNEALGRVEMHLVSRVGQGVRLLGERLHFAAGEGIHTESSYKYAVDEFAALAAGAGWRAQAVWVDPERLFSIHYCEADPA